MVPETNTIVNPRAVVVHSENTCVAHAAVVAPIRLIPHAPLTMPPLACVLCLNCGEALITLGELRGFRIKLPLRRVRDCTGMDQNATDEAIHQQGCVTVEDNKLPHPTAGFRLVPGGLGEIKLQSWHAMKKDIHDIQDHNQG